jgi:putative Ca2+/H+ antiporter (TMEM165/GDT1 family)
LCLEIGDRTFFIAALLSAKHPAVTVFAGAFGTRFPVSQIGPLRLPRCCADAAAWSQGRCL